MTNVLTVPYDLQASGYPLKNGEQHPRTVVSKRMRGSVPTLSETNNYWIFDKTYSNGCKWLLWLGNKYDVARGIILHCYIRFTFERINRTVARITQTRIRQMFQR
jgi:hypothetical protein